MSFPCFIDIEFVSDGDFTMPTSIAWSLPNGQIKTVVIEPDDAWLDEDSTLANVSFLEEQGAPIMEIVRELHQDLSDQTVYVDGFDPDEDLIEQLFSAVNSEAPFEIAAASELFTELSIDEIDDQRRSVLASENLEPQLPENTVYALLVIARDNRLL